MSAQFELRRFNVTEYYKMAKAGILKPDDRVELIEGEVIKMGAIGSPHASCVARLTRLLPKAVGDTAILFRKTRFVSTTFLSRSPTLRCSSRARITIALDTRRQQTRSC